MRTQVLVIQPESQSCLERKDLSGKLQYNGFFQEKFFFLPWSQWFSTVLLLKDKAQIDEGADNGPNRRDTVVNIALLYDARYKYSMGHTT